LENSEVITDIQDAVQDLDTILGAVLEGNLVAVGFLAVPILMLAVTVGLIIRSQRKLRQENSE
jgi:hypothetical protein